MAAINGFGCAMATEKGRVRFGVDYRTREIVVGTFRARLPQSRAMRCVVGGLLVLGGIFGFLPVLGFWMIPLGLLVLSHDSHFVRRQRRRLAIWWANRRAR